MFWRRKDSASAPVPATKPETMLESDPSADAELNQALDAFGEILRARSRYAYSIEGEKAAELFEGWAKHILTRAPSPLVLEKGGKDGVPVVSRDWRGLIDFVGRRSKREQEHVNGTMRDMRDAIYSLVESIGKTSGAAGRNDRILTDRIKALGAAVEAGSVESLKRDAVAVADAVTRAMAEQRALHEAQNADLKARLELLGEQLEQTRRDGDTDGLTRVANRKAFDVALARALTIATVVGRPVTLVMVDVDHFKSVNDQHGHPGGDEVLKALANALSKAFPRRSDIVARYGGEEFAIVLPDSGEQEVGVLCDRLLNVVRALRIKLPSERTLAITVSAGAAVALPGESAVELVERADRVLYQSKRAGRNRWCVAPATPRALDAAAE